MLTKLYPNLTASVPVSGHALPKKFSQLKAEGFWGSRAEELPTLTCARIGWESRCPTLAWNNSPWHFRFAAWLWGWPISKGYSHCWKPAGMVWLLPMENGHPAHWTERALRLITLKHLEHYTTSQCWLKDQMSTMTLSDSMSLFKRGPFSNQARPEEACLTLWEGSLTSQQRH